MQARECSVRQEPLKEIITNYIGIVWKFLQVTCLAIMVALRKLNRLDKHRLKTTRDAVKENRSRVDGLHLQLQNLAYEAGYLRSEVDKCLEFKFVLPSRFLRLYPLEML